MLFERNQPRTPGAQSKQQEAEPAAVTLAREAQNRGFQPMTRTQGRQLVVSMSAEERGKPYRRQGRRLIGSDLTVK